MKLEEYFKIIYGSQPKLRFRKCYDAHSHFRNFSRHSHPYLELMYFMEGKGNLGLRRTDVYLVI